MPVLGTITISEASRFPTSAHHGTSATLRWDTSINSAICKQDAQPSGRAEWSCGGTDQSGITNSGEPRKVPCRGEHIMWVDRLGGQLTPHYLRRYGSLTRISDNHPFQRRPGGRTDRLN